MLALALALIGITMVSLIETRVVWDYGLFYFVRLPFRQRMREFMRIHWRELDVPQRSMYWGGWILFLVGFVLMAV